MAEIVSRVISQWKTGQARLYLQKRFVFNDYFADTQEQISPLQPLTQPLTGLV